LEHVSHTVVPKATAVLRTQFERFWNLAKIQK
jgi:hypothetical protein